MNWVAQDLMTTDVVCVKENMDLRELAQVFAREGIGGAPVVDEDGNISGVVSQTDLIDYGLSRDDELRIEPSFYDSVRLEGGHIPRGYQMADANNGDVSEIMNPVVHSVRPSTPVSMVAEMLVSHHIHRVIVLEGRKVQGILSALDLVCLLASPKKNSDRAQVEPTTH